MLFYPILGHFWCSVVTLVTFSSKLSNFEKNPKNQEQVFKKRINLKMSKNLIRSRKFQELQKITSFFLFLRIRFFFNWENSYYPKH